MRNYQKPYNIQSQESITGAIEKLTSIELNETTKKIGFLFGIFIFFSLFLLGALLGVIALFIAMFIMGTFAAVINGIFTGNFASSNSWYDIFLVWVFPITFFAFIIRSIFLIHTILKQVSITQNLRNEVFGLYTKLQETNIVQENIEEIQNNVENIYKKIRTIKRLLLFRFFYSEKGKKKLRELSILVTNITLYILQNLRSDLSIRLTEQQKLLESAISETNSNLKGTSELVNISELQQARLDRQIEQFEELQRVLMKG